MTDYILPKEDYDASLSEISLDKVIDLNAVEDIDLLKIDVLEVIALGDKNVSVDIAKNLYLYGQKDGLASEKIKVNGYALIRIKVTAVDQGNLWDSDLQSTVINIKLGNPIAKMKQEIANLQSKNEENERNLIVQNQEIIALRKQNELGSAIENQEIINLKQQIDDLRNSNNKQPIDARLRAQWISEHDEAIVHFEQHLLQVLSYKLKAPYNQVYQQFYQQLKHGFDLDKLSRSTKMTRRDAVHHLRSLYTMIRGVKKFDFDKSFFSEEHYHPTHATSFGLLKGYIETFDCKSIKGLSHYIIDPQAVITVKKPLATGRSITITQPTSVTAYFEFPVGTINIEYYDETVGKRTARLDGAPNNSNTITLDIFKKCRFLPGEPGTKNIFTIAAKLSNGKITKPITFLSETPALAITGSK